MIKIAFGLAVIMEFISLLAIIFKEKSVLLIKRISLLSKEKKREHDIYRLSKKISNVFFTAGFILIVGIILKNFMS